MSIRMRCADFAVDVESQACSVLFSDDWGKVWLGRTSAGFERFDLALGVVSVDVH